VTKFPLVALLRAAVVVAVVVVVAVAVVRRAGGSVASAHATRIDLEIGIELQVASHRLLLLLLFTSNKKYIITICY
jgi:hypothetical protein